MILSRTPVPHQWAMKARMKQGGTSSRKDCVDAARPYDKEESERQTKQQPQWPPLALKGSVDGRDKYSQQGNYGDQSK